MTNRLYLLLLSAAILQACGSGSDNTTPEINYASLDSLQTEVVLEIGESEDYLPGELQSLIVTSDGGMLVSDRASVSIEQFDDSGNHLATVAEEGEGPGELARFFRMKDIGNDTLLVSEQATQRTYYAPGKDGLYSFVRASVPSELPDRTINIQGAQSDTAYYARTGLVIRDIQTAMKNETDYYKSAVVLVSPSAQILQDSLHLLKSPSSHISQSGGGFRINSVPYRYDDHFVLLGNGKYLIARPDSSAIDFYSSDQKLEKSLKLNIAQRPVSDADLEYELEDVDSKIRSEIEARVDEQKPPFLNVWASEHYLWLHTDTSEEGKEIVVLDYDGNAIGKFMLPEVDSIQEIKENRIYTIHRSLIKGHLIRVYEVQL